MKVLQSLMEFSKFQPQANSEKEKKYLISYYPYSPL